MTTEKMTIHKALCELKTLDARITKCIGETEYVFANKHSNDKVNGMTVAAYCDEIKSGYQRVTDLIRRRDAIKRAVVLSNAVTKVTVGGKEYTVAEAIEMKNHGIQMLQTLLKRLERDNRAARNEANQNNGEMLEMRADEYIKSLYGNTDMKNASEDIKKTRADFIAAQINLGIADIQHAATVVRIICAATISNCCHTRITGVSQTCCAIVCIVFANPEPGADIFAFV